jgi:hypothetical protein
MQYVIIFLPSFITMSTAQASIKKPDRTYANAVATPHRRKLQRPRLSGQPVCCAVKLFVIIIHQDTPKQVDHLSVSKFHEVRRQQLEASA